MIFDFLQMFLRSLIKHSRPAGLKSWKSSVMMPMVSPDTNYRHSNLFKSTGVAPSWTSIEVKDESEDDVVDDEDNMMFVQKEDITVRSLYLPPTKQPLLAAHKGPISSPIFLQI